MTALPAALGRLTAMCRLLVIKPQRPDKTQFHILNLFIFLKTVGSGPNSRNRPFFYAPAPRDLNSRPAFPAKRRRNTAAAKGHAGLTLKIPLLSRRVRPCRAARLSLLHFAYSQFVIGRDIDLPERDQYLVLLLLRKRLCSLFRLKAHLDPDTNNIKYTVLSPAHAVL